MFANTIKEILEDYKKAGKNLTQNDIANVLGMTKQSFSNKMQRNTFTAEEVVIIAEYLNMKAILKGENEYIIKQQMKDARKQNKNCFLFLFQNKYTKLCTKYLNSSTQFCVFSQYTKYIKMCTI